ncbi:MAG TPA: apolipoprotein N-acyltransferase, partial [Pyrinomonadaceae bacterium]|nr:apolipoprotein N-acyltransferase [Pyrinomonadaceae bacterium]
ALAALTTGFLILSFPNFESPVLAWIGLVPLLVAIARRPSPWCALILGWATGTVFFYVTCHWLTYSMIHYGGLPAVLAYLLLIPGAVVIGIFPGIFAALMALAIRQWGSMALLLAPIFWPALEWARLGVTGQLWNALGYSQAYHSMLITPANWGGVYAVSFIILAINTVVALLIVRRTRWTVLVSSLTALFVLLTLVLSAPPPYERWNSSDVGGVTIVALQPNVPMKAIKSVEETKELVQRHLTLSTSALQSILYNGRASAKLVVWPESPMNFTYGSDHALQELLANFTKENHTSLLFNSLERAPADGSYNSALLINDSGRLISQYDKIRLMPFGEYVPLPQWLPGASLITGLVGEFTPGTNYTLMPFGGRRHAGVFICIESAYPWVARRLTKDGANVLINISNDGYLGPTAVMRQHLANAIFRAVENGRPVLRVTNSGLTTYISSRGLAEDLTKPFEADVRVWSVDRSDGRDTFYTDHGDLFVQICAALTVIVVGAAPTIKTR